MSSPSDLEREVRAALETAWTDWSMAKTGFVDYLVANVVRLIEEQRAPLIEQAETWRRAAEAEVGAGRAQVARAEKAEAAIERIRALGESWVGFDDSHTFGDAVLLTLLGEDGAS